MSEPAEPARPFERCYWVEPGRLLAGCYPASAEDAAALGRIVTLVVDLTEAHERSPYAEALAGPEWRRMAVPDFSAPPAPEMTRTLDAVDAEVERGGVVYVHCGAGRGRTGTVVGCYLVRHGLASDEALARVAELRRELPDGFEPSPEVAEQLALIRSWQRGR